jgi:hypothetical protein
MFIRLFTDDIQKRWSLYRFSIFAFNGKPLHCVDRRFGCVDLKKPFE